jgi:hypothetical protein
LLNRWLIHGKGSAGSLSIRLFVIAVSYLPTDNYLRNYAERHYI